MIASYTIAQGQTVAVWDRQGRRTLVSGPRRLGLWGRRVQKLEPRSAGPGEYLVVKFTDGRVAHVPGPASVWVDPVEHASVEAAPAVVLDANDAVVVYRHDQGNIDRRILRGPARFVPTADEWLHTFSWHGADPSNPRKKVPRGLRFQKLRVIPDQMYFDVDEVRTSDDAVLTVKLMVFFELVDIERMLDQTHDVTADFINALTADVIDFVASGTFERFKERTERMNDLATYRQLTGRAERIGYRINKVVYRGYQATAKLQSMHDGAIESRTRLKLEAETEAQAQDLADLKLTREQDRAARQQQMRLSEADLERQLTRAEHDEQLRRDRVEADQRLKLAQARTDADLTAADSRYRQRVVYLEKVAGLNVDLTRLLVARHERPDRRIRVDGPARVHLHETN